jgi:plasmid stability protein
LRVAMKVQAESIQYTIRGVPREVDRALRQKAARQKRSLSQVILEELTEATIGGRQKTDFSDVTGRWTPDAAFDKTMAAQHLIDWDKWK